MKKIFLGYILLFSVLFVIFFGGRMDLLRLGPQKYQSETGVSYIAKAEGKTFSIYESDTDRWRELFVTGVNIGATKPGYFPGDFAITREEYLRWFQYISDMNANTIRVYVLQMPEFYQALKEFNEISEKPLYLMHGVYLNENDIGRYQDAYAADGLIRNSFLQDIRNIVDVIHGNKYIERTPGNAGGSYSADISAYVTGWILGIEWEHVFVRTTNDNHPEYTSYDGNYLYTVDATPFEVFLAEAADTAISYEMDHYNEQRPLAMSNWVTSDPLSHPGEPEPGKEDSVSIDMEKLLPKEGFEAGFFASYHVYPYYPDLFNYAPEYLQEDPPNSYRAYLTELNAHHSMPVLISEVGIPASRGITHENIHSGFNQGHIDETRQGEILTHLMDDIQGEDMMGAIIFSWQDEWFKRTWNTMDLDIDTRRPYWSDYQTNEQNFGILSFDPGETESVSYVDGDISEWSETDVIAQDEHTSLSVKSDEKFLYLMIKTDSSDDEPLYLFFDTVSGQGNTTYRGRSLDLEADFMLVLDGGERSKLLIDPYYDANYFLYGYQLDIMERDLSYERKNSGRFVPIYQMLLRGFTLPSGEEIPYSLFETGTLRHGNANPASEDYDSLADFCITDGAVELRIPWLLLHVSDPSSKQVIADMYLNQAIVHQTAEDIQISLQRDGTAAPALTGAYAWEPWDMPTYHERLKASYGILQAYNADIEAAALPSKTSFRLFWGRWNQTQFFNVGFWFPIQPWLNYLIAFLLSVILYFFLTLIYIHSASAVRTMQQHALRQRICAAVSGESVAVYSPRRRRFVINGLRRPFSRNSLLIFSQMLEDSDAQEREQVCDVMLKLGYKTYVTKQLNTKDEEYLTLMIRLIGYLGLREQADAVQHILYKHPGNTSLQYQCLLTLSLLGAYDQIVAIAMNRDFVQRLSFRSLQEILKSYCGDKLHLYDTLLSSPDEFIKRISIKRIGVEQFSELAEKLCPYLDASNFNMVIDATRSLGQLAYEPATQKIISLLQHDRWEVRAVAVSALASINVSLHEEHIIQALSDPEFQVRSNAAAALCQTDHVLQILKRVEDAGDRYAFEVLNYMVHTHGIWEMAT